MESENGKFEICPHQTLDSCLSMVRELVKRKGEGTAISRKDISVILGKAESTLIRPISSCLSYGLLENSHGQGYKVTSLINKIDNPVMPEDVVNTKIEALGKPYHYKKIIHVYNGKILPPEDGLANLLKTKEYGVIANSAPITARVFFENFKSVGLIDEGNRLKYLVNTITPHQAEPKRLAPPADPPLDEEPPFVKDPTAKVLPMPLTDGKMAYFNYPSKINARDFKIIEVYLSGIRMTIEIEGGKGEV